MLNGLARKHITAYKRYISHKYKALNTIELKRSALLFNVQLYKSINSDIDIIPVLKANAYGHGLREVAEILNDTKCLFLAVDGYFEAARISHISKHRILVLGYIDPVNVNLLATKRCSFVVQDISMLRALGNLGKPVKVHMELNTGMNRLGLSPAQVGSYLTAIKQYKNIELEGVMTHLSDADNPRSKDVIIEQIRRFDQQIEKILKSGIRPKYFHAANSAGIIKVHSKYMNAARVGLGLYGISPLQDIDEYSHRFNDLQPVLELKSTIIKTIDLKVNERVSYNGTFVAKKPTRIAVLPLGYYEGVPRSLSNRGYITYKDKVFPIVGRVCMNHTMINLGKEKLAVGDEVVVISSDKNDPNSIASISKNLGEFSYSTLVNLDATVRRIVV